MQGLHPLMKNQVEAVEKLHHQDLADGYGEVYLPGALPRLIRDREITHSLVLAAFYRFFKEYRDDFSRLLRQI